MMIDFATLAPIDNLDDLQVDFATDSQSLDDMVLSLDSLDNFSLSIDTTQ